MSENWQAGDLALRIGTPKSGWVDHHAPIRPVTGKIYPVVHVFHGEAFGKSWTALVIKGAISSWRDGAWNSEGFIKVTPTAADEFDRETIELMRGKPVEVA